LNVRTVKRGKGEPETLSGVRQSSKEVGYWNRGCGRVLIDRGPKILFSFDCDHDLSLPDGKISVSWRLACTYALLENRQSTVGGPGTPIPGV